MVTTFSPPVRGAAKKKKQLPVVPIALGVACAVLLIAVFVFMGKSSSASQRADALGDTVVKIAEATGTDAVTPEVLADASAAPAALEALAASVSAQAAELETSRAALERAQADAAQAQTDLDAALQAGTAAREQADSASRDLRTRSSDLAALQKKYDEDVARLNAQIASLQAELAAGSQPEAEQEAEVEVAAAVAVEEEIAEETAADVTAEAVAPAAGDVAKGKPERSAYFASYQYEAGSSNLTLVASGGKKLKFSDVPQSVYDGLTSAPVFDVFFRFQLMDVYPSKPDARAFMLDLND